MPGIVGIYSPDGYASALELATMTGALNCGPQFCLPIEIGDGSIGVQCAVTNHRDASSRSYSRRYPELGLSLAFCGEIVPSGCSDKLINPVIRAYFADPEAFPSSLNGTFSGVLIDHRRGTALMFNDRFGIERLYIHQRGSQIYFASEAKCILRLFSDTRSFDTNSLKTFLTFGFVTGVKTLFRGIELLEPGTRFDLNRLSARKKRYFVPNQWVEQPELSLPDFEQGFASTLQTAIPRYFESDDRLALSLTGGLDTRMILACLPNDYKGRHSYTYSGFKRTHLDFEIAARLASICELNHHNISLTAEFLHSFFTHVNESVYLSDGTCLANGAHELFYSRHASVISPIRLTGNFGSEILRGVTTLKPLSIDPRLFPNVTKDHLCHISSSSRTSAVERATFLEIPYKLIGTMLVARSQLVFRTPYLDNDIVRLAFQAPERARNASTAIAFINSVRPQLASVPTDRGVSLDNSNIQSVLRQLWAEFTFKADYYDTEGFPGGFLPLNTILTHATPKRFLGAHKFLPYWRWFKEDLSGPIADILLSHSVTDIPLLSTMHIDRTLKAHRSGLRNHTTDIVLLLTLAAVKATLFNPSFSPTRSISKHEALDRQA